MHVRLATPAPPSHHRWRLGKLSARIAVLQRSLLPQVAPPTRKASAIPTLVAQIVPDLLRIGPIAAVIYGLIGIVLLLLGYKLFDWLTPQVHVQKELMQNNMAVAIVVAALLLGIAFIVAHVVQ